jgi:hypothetical protein
MYAFLRYPMRAACTAYVILLVSIKSSVLADNRGILYTASDVCICALTEDVVTPITRQMATNGRDVSFDNADTTQH